VLPGDVYVQYLSPSETLRFGPEVLKLLSIATRDTWIDFDTGRTIDEPAGFRPDVKGMDASVDQFLALRLFNIDIVLLNDRKNIGKDLEVRIDVVRNGSDFATLGHSQG